MLLLVTSARKLGESAMLQVNIDHGLLLLQLWLCQCMSSLHIQTVASCATTVVVVFSLMALCAAVVLGVCKALCVE